MADNTWHDNAAEQYDASYHYFQARLARQGPLSYEWWAGRFVARLLRRYQPGGRLLEIGCGLGRTLRLLERDFETYGIDISGYAVEVARQATTRSHIVQMDAHNLSAFAPASFDVILAAHVLEHLAQPAMTLAHCARLLKPRGVLLCFMPNTECISRRWKGQNWFGFRDPGHISLLTPQEWIEQIEAAGLYVATVFSDGLWDAPYLPLFPTVIQRLFFLLPALLQFQIGYPFMPLRLGEDIGLIARK